MNEACDKGKLRVSYPMTRPPKSDLSGDIATIRRDDSGGQPTNDYGLRREALSPLETLAQTLLGAGEDEFARAIASADRTEELRRRLQLKTLLFGMGETFRVLWQRREGLQFGEKSP